MSYIGNPIISTDFPKDTFSGNGSTTAFTMSIAPASVNAVIVVVSGVVQEPSTYTISGTTLTFSAAPPSGTSNISVRHLGVAGIPNVPSAASVTSDKLATQTSIPFATGSIGAGNASIMKNRIINGAMVIDQRNAGASVTPTNNQYSLDRWQFQGSQASKLTMQQNAGSVTPPVGFVNYLGVTSSSAYSVGATDYFLVRQAIEGYNMADLGWGTANAKTVTLSFQVYSSLTGIFGGSLSNNGDSRCYPFSYTVSSANTWTTVSITIAGDTTGTWQKTTSTGINIYFSMGTGSTYLGSAGTWAGTAYYGATGQTNLVGTNGATFYITGVQLEVGSSATGFEYRQYGTELALCQRYAWVTSRIAATPIALGQAVNTNYVTCMLNNPVPMRTAPSISINNQTYFRLTNAANSGLANTSSGSLGTANENITRVDFVSSSTYLVAGNVSALLNSDTSNNNGIITISAEL